MPDIACLTPKDRFLHDLVCSLKFIPGLNLKILKDDAACLGARNTGPKIKFCLFVLYLPTHLQPPYSKNYIVVC